MKGRAIVFLVVAAIVIFVNYLLFTGWEAERVEALPSIKTDTVKLLGSVQSHISKNAWGQDIKVKYADEWEHSNGAIVHAQEYQLKLDSRLWTYRDQYLNEFLKTLNDLAEGLFRFSLFDSVENVRTQSYVDDTTGCGKKKSVRIRNYIWGFQSGFSTVDIKSISQEGIESVIDEALDPNPSLLATSIQKLEKDVHPCKDDKWSRETRITDVPFSPMFETCRQLAYLFPQIFKGHPAKMDNLIGLKKLDYWWQLSQFGEFEDGTKWKAAITLKYKSAIHAIDGTTKPEPRGEWSLRVYAQDSGKGEFNATLIQQVDEFYIRAISTLGSQNEWPCPSPSPEQQGEIQEEN